MREIFRKYPHRFTLMIKYFSKNMEEVKIAFVGILGEYSDKIEDAAFQS